MSNLEIYFLGITFLVGTCIGSFLNVVIYRLPLELPFGNSRSFCPHCHSQLKFYDLIPILSWLCLRGKCRVCQKPISLRYPLIELLCGIIACLCVVSFGFSYRGILNFGIVMSLLVIAMIDYDTMYIYDSTLWFLFVIICALLFQSGNIVGYDSLIGCLIISLPMYLLNHLILDCFGGGDIKLMAIIGIWLGAKLSIIAFFIAVFSGGFYAIYVLLQKKVKRQDHIAFGPFLCFGIVISQCYGETLYTLYRMLC